MNDYNNNDFRNYQDFRDHNYEYDYKKSISSSEGPVSMGTWVFLFIVNGILGIIPILGPILIIIIYLVLAFGSDINKSLQNFARAVLLLAAIGFIIILFLSATGRIGNELCNLVNNVEKIS